MSRAKVAIGLRFANRGASCDAEIRRPTCRPRARNELRRAFADRDETVVAGSNWATSAKQVAVERAAQALVRADQDHGAFANFAHCPASGWVKSPAVSRRVTLDAIQQSERTAAWSARLSCALRIFDAATICIALVICAVLLTDLMRRRMSRVLGIDHRLGVLLSTSA